MKNCSMCSKFLQCPDPLKGPNYHCQNFDMITDNQVENLLTMFPETKTEIQKVKVLDIIQPNEEKDFQKLFEAALDPSLSIPPDLKIDDRDIPQAANFFEFCMSSQGLNQPPFARQLWVFIHLFGEWCPNPSCTNLDIWENILDFPVDYKVADAPNDITFLKYGVCPKCGARKSNLTQFGTKLFLNDYMELALLCGMRSGKTIGTTLAVSYLIHRYLKLQDPTRVFQLTKNTNLTMTFVALTFGKAKSLLYNPVYKMIKSSPWFECYGELMQHYENLYGVDDIFNIGKEFMHFGHRNFSVYPASPSKRILRGDSRICCVVDEIGWFPHGEESNDRERASANEVYEALDRSMLTVRDAYETRVASGFDNIPNAYGIYASSPSANNDKIMSLVRTFKNSDVALAVHLPTWQINPKISRNSRAIQKAYAENHTKAERDYGANPPLSDASFIGDISQLLETFSTKPNLIGDYIYTSLSRGSTTRRAAKFRMEKFKQIKFPTILTLDAGQKSNSFALTVGGINGKGRICVIGCMEIVPLANRPLDFHMIQKNIIYPLIDRLNVVKVVTDRWQSIKILHDIEQYQKLKGKTIIASEYSLRRDDFDFVLDYMLDRDTSPILPKLEMEYEDIVNLSVQNYPHCFKYKPISHLLFQMTTVRETARTIDKGQGYTDDIFRTLFLLLAHLYDEEDAKWLLEQKLGMIKKSTGGLISSSLSMNKTFSKEIRSSNLGSVSGSNTSSKSKVLKIGG